MNNNNNDTKSPADVNREPVNLERAQAFYAASPDGTIANESAALLLHLAKSQDRERKRLVNELTVLQRVIESQIAALKNYPQMLPDRTWEIGSTANRIDHHIMSLNIYRELSMLGNDILDANDNALSAASNGDGEARNE